MLADVQMHLRASISPSTVLRGHSPKPELHVLRLALCAALPPPRKVDVEPGLTRPKHKCLFGYNPGEDEPACTSLPKAEIKNSASLLVRPAATKLIDVSAKRPGTETYSMSRSWRTSDIRIYAIARRMAHARAGRSWTTATPAPVRTMQRFWTGFVQLNARFP